MNLKRKLSLIRRPLIFRNDVSPNIDMSILCNSISTGCNYHDLGLDLFRTLFISFRHYGICFDSYCLYIHLYTGSGSHLTNSPSLTMQCQPGGQHLFITAGQQSA